MSLHNTERAAGAGEQLCQLRVRQSGALCTEALFEL
jgi:hypothetical protein